MRSFILAAAILAAAVPVLSTGFPPCGGENGGLDSSASTPAAAGADNHGCLLASGDVEDAWLVTTVPGQRVEIDLETATCDHVILAIHHEGQELDYREGCGTLRAGAVAPGHQLLVSVRLPHAYPFVLPSPLVLYRMLVVWDATPACGLVQNDAGSGRDAGWASPVAVEPGEITVCLDRWDVSDVLTGTVKAGDLLSVDAKDCMGLWLSVDLPGDDGAGRDACAGPVGSTARADGTFRIGAIREREGPVTLVVARGALPRTCLADDAGTGRDTTRQAPAALPDGGSAGCLDAYDNHDHFTLIKAADERLVLRGDARCANYHFILTQPGGLVRAWDRSSSCHDEAVLVEWSSYAGPLHLHVDRTQGEGAYTLQVERIAAP